jgi:hypothetical protein
MELDKIIIIDPANLPAFTQQIMGEVKKLIAEERKAQESYLNTTELSEMFPRTPEWFRDKINAKAFGKKERGGECWAKYSEVEKYIFNNKR